VPETEGKVCRRYGKTAGAVWVPHEISYEDRGFKQAVVLCLFKDYGSRYSAPKSGQSGAFGKDRRQTAKISGKGRNPSGTLVQRESQSFRAGQRDGKPREDKEGYPPVDRVRRAQRGVGRAEQI